MRCVRDHVWIQKNLISLLATTITPNDRSGAQPLRQIKIRNSGGGKTGLAERATDRPDRPAGDEDGSRLTRKRYSHFFTCGQNSRTFAFKSWQR